MKFTLFDVGDDKTVLGLDGERVGFGFGSFVVILKALPNPSICLGSG